MAAADTIRREVETWAGITVGPHRFAGIEFLLGKAEIGHLHGNSLLDIAFTKAVRNTLIAEGKALPHHVAPESGWISFYLRSEADVEHAIWLLKLSYLRHVLLLRRKPRGGELVAAVDTARLLDSLSLSADLQSVLKGL